MCTFEILTTAGLSHHTSTAQRDWVLSPLNSNALFMLASHWVYPELPFPGLRLLGMLSQPAGKRVWEGCKTLLQSTEHAAQPSAGKASPPSYLLGKEKWPSFKISTSSFQQCSQTAVQVCTLQDHLPKGKSWKSGIGTNKYRHAVLKIYISLIISSRLCLIFPTLSWTGERCLESSVTYPGIGWWSDREVRAASHSASKAECLTLQSCLCSTSLVFTQHPLPKDTYCV